jgi:glycosyltransferase involved in cell wall biosynthesis
MNAPRRVIWLTEAFYPPIVGGQELFAAQAVRALAARGLDVRVITRQTLPPAAALERIGAVEVRRIAPAGILKGKGWRALGPLLGFLVRLALLLLRERQRFDVLIVSGVKIIPLVVVPVCLLTGKRCILRAESFFELHESVSAESLRSMAMSGRGIGRLAGFVRRAMLRRADFVIAISDQIRAQLIDSGVAPARIRQIPNAVDTDRFHPVTAGERHRLRLGFGLPADKTLLIFSGRLSRAKGLPMLVEAWPALLERHPDLHLVIVGSGKLSFDDCEQEIREFVRTRQLGGSVQFAGETDRVHEYLQAADLFVFPTEYEGFSLALVEALSCAMPVVVTAVGAAPDLIRSGENGFLFPPKDPAAMLAALFAALAQRGRWAAIGDAARATVAPFDLAVVADQYRQLCEERPAGGEPA